MPPRGRRGRSETGSGGRGAHDGGQRRLRRRAASDVGGCGISESIYMTQGRVSSEMPKLDSTNGLWHYRKTETEGQLEEAFRRLAIISPRPHPPDAGGRGVPSRMRRKPARSDRPAQAGGLRTSTVTPASGQARAAGARGGDLAPGTPSATSSGMFCDIFVGHAACRHEVVPGADLRYERHGTAPAVFGHPVETKYRCSGMLGMPRERAPRRAVNSR